MPKPQHSSRSKPCNTSKDKNGCWTTHPAPAQTQCETMCCLSRDLHNYVHQFALSVIMCANDDFNAFGEYLGHCVDHASKEKTITLPHACLRISPTGCGSTLRSSLRHHSRSRDKNTSSIALVVLFAVPNAAPLLYIPSARGSNLQQSATMSRSALSEDRMTLCSSTIRRTCSVPLTTQHQLR
jgi:hypothetical protein